MTKKSMIAAWTGFDKYTLWFVIWIFGLIGVGCLLKACGHWHGF